MGNLKLRMNNCMNLTDLASFVAVVEHGTMAEAARTEGVPKSTISRRVSRLEEALGVQLLVRSARSFAITAEGRRLHARARGALLELRDVREALVEDRHEPRGHLVVSAPHDVTRAWFFAALLARYRATHPQVTIEVRLASHYVDLVMEGVDVALRGHRALVPGEARLRVKKLGEARGAFYASEEYVSRCGTPESLAQLHVHDLVVHSVMMSGLVAMESSSGRRVEVDVANAVLKVNDLGLMHSLAMEGLGVALLPVRSAARDQHRGLVRVLPQWSVELGRISLVWPQARFMAPRVQAFIDMAVEQFERVSW